MLSVSAVTILASGAKGVGAALGNQVSIGGLSLATNISPAEQSIRLHIRFDAGWNQHPGSASARIPTVDVSIPGCVSLAEALPEVLELAEAPRISLPWMARTAAGQPIDLSLSLSQSQFSHGDVVIFTPLQEVEPPLRKDAAESLADLPITARSIGLSAAAAGGGLLSLGMAAVLFAIPTVPTGFLTAVVSALVMGITIWHYHLHPRDVSPRNVVYLGSVILAGLSTWLLITDSALRIPMTHVGPVAAASLSVAFVVATLLFWAAGPSLMMFLAVATTTGLSIMGGLSLLFLPGLSHAMAVVVLVGFVVLLFAPSVSTNLAGLRVPRLPAAGQGLDIADHVINRPRERAKDAIEILGGLCLGLGVSEAVALLYLGLYAPQPSIALGLALACSLAVFLHAGRHRSSVATWGLWIWAVSGIVSAALAGLSAGIAGMIIAVCAGLLATSAPLWAERISTLTPTTMSALEKCESLALALSFPLAAHLAGLFEAMRGLG